MSKVGKVSSLLKFLEADEIEIEKNEGEDAANAGDGDAVEKVLEGEGDDAVNAGDGDAVEKVLEAEGDSEEDKKDESDAQTVDDDQVFVGETDDEDLLLLEVGDDEEDGDKKDESDESEEDKKDEAEDAANAGDGDAVEKVLEAEVEEDEKLESLLLKFNMPASSFVEAKAILKELVESKALRLTTEAEKTIRKTYAESNQRKLKRVMENVVAYSRRAAKKFVEQHEQQFVETAKFAKYESFVESVNKNFVEFGMDANPKVATKIASLKNEISTRNKTIDDLNTKLEAKDMKIEAHKIAAGISVLTEGMTKTDADRLVRIVESLEVRDYKDFVKKAESVKAKVFGEGERDKKEYDTFVESFDGKTKDKKNLGVVSETTASENLVSAAAKVLANG
jgi:hypothetical protein